MKKEIHPKYGPAVIRCACGSVIETKSTKPEIAVDICSACHPFFTGTQKLVDTAGRIEKFHKKFKGRVVSKGEVKKVKPSREKEPKATKAKTEPKKDAEEKTAAS